MTQPAETSVFPSEIGLFVGNLYHCMTKETSFRRKSSLQFLSASVYVLENYCTAPTLATSQQFVAAKESAAEGKETLLCGCGVCRASDHSCSHTCSHTIWPLIANFPGSITSNRLGTIPCKLPQDHHIKFAWDHHITLIWDHPMHASSGPSHQAACAGASASSSSSTDTPSCVCSQRWAKKLE